MSTSGGSMGPHRYTMPYARAGNMYLGMEQRRFVRGCLLFHAPFGHVYPSATSRSPRNHSRPPIISARPCPSNPPFNNPLTTGPVKRQPEARKEEQRADHCAPHPGPPEVNLVLSVRLGEGGTKHDILNLTRHPSPHRSDSAT